MNLLNGVYLLNEVIGVNGVILMYGDDWDEFGECGVCGKRGELDKWD